MTGWMLIQSAIAAHPVVPGGPWPPLGTPLLIGFQQKRGQSPLCNATTRDAARRRQPLRGGGAQTEGGNADLWATPSSPDHVTSSSLSVRLTQLGGTGRHDGWTPSRRLG